MISQKEDELVLRISDLDCQIECLAQAIRLNVSNADEETRLNSLIVKRAHCRKELEALITKQGTHSFLDKFNIFSHQPKKISDYFS